MRMFQSISGHSSEQSIAHYSSRPTVTQLKGVSHTISNWFEDHQPQRTQISTITNVPFVQNSNRMASRLTAAASFPSIIFQLLQSVTATSVTHSAIASCATFLFLPHFDIICDLLLNRRTATWNLFVNLKSAVVHKVELSSSCQACWQSTPREDLWCQW